MFSSLRKVINNYLEFNRKKLSTYFFFFIFSFLFWFLTMMSRSHEASIEIPIRYINFPVDLILTEDPIDKINIRVKSSGFLIFFHHLFNPSEFTLNFSCLIKNPDRNVF